MAERVQKVLSQWGIASRRKAEKMIREGRVKVNDRIAKLGDKVDLAVDTLEVDRKKIELQDRPEKVYLLLNKPLGVVSTCYDPQQRSTILDLLPAKLKKGQGIHPVGRLDVESTGALLLTNDGSLTLKLTHPRYHLPKTYHVYLEGCPTAQDLKRWRNGVTLFGRKTLPAQVNVIRKEREKTLLEIVLIEGRNRQIRLVAERLGFSVISLHRVSIGSINLKTVKQGNLPTGEYRHLSKTEVDFLKNNRNKKNNNLAASKRKAVHGKSAKKQFQKTSKYSS